MHELGIAVQIYRACREAARPHGPGRIESVKVAVGELAAVEPDLIVFAWQAVTAEGPDAGARLEVQWCPARKTCADCGEVQTATNLGWLALCPSCGNQLRVEGGNELDLLELTYTTEDELSA